ncbi:MAG: hypothetical protein QOD75_2421 [Blastocatellia bacterium]|jgi:hypothetical protein|nr:hypothetical protein [Blastocatellia bacterium]
MKPARLVIVGALIIASTGLYLWWCHPKRVDMAGYVPADSLLYFEANDLSSIVSGIINTDSWEAMSSGAAIRPRLESATWLTRLARWTGIGSSEEVILARSQFALAVIALETTDAEPALMIRPALALVVETHTTERRIRPAIEKRVEGLASQVYPHSTPERKSIDGISFTEWVSPEDGRRIVLAFFNSEVILGNDERAVSACIAVRRGNSKSLLDNPDVRLMRSRLVDDTVAAFGYISPDGLSKLLAAIAPLYVEGISTNPQGQRLLSNLVAKVFQSAGWALRFHDGIIEDRYFVALPPEISRLLADAFAAEPNSSSGATVFLPSTTYSFTRYNPSNPGLAWRGLNTALSSHLDILGAVLVTPVLKGALSPYGIEDPEAFLNAARPDIVTARLDENESHSVIIVPVKDESTLRKLVTQRLGANPKSERVNSYEMLTSSTDDGLTASFAEQYLLLGPAPLVRGCLMAKSQGPTVASLPSFRRASQFPLLVPPISVSYSSDLVSAKALFSLTSGQPVESIKDGRELGEIPFAVSTTSLTGEGIEKVTRSSAGLVGVMISYFNTGISAK